jgi:hypothetical protein
MTESIHGPGILFVRSRISSPLLSESTFLQWYDDDHIPEVVATSGIKSGFRYVDVNKTSSAGDARNAKPFLAVYPMDDLTFTQGDEFRGIRVKSDLLPRSGIVYDLTEMDVSYSGLKEKTEGTGKAKFVLSCGLRPVASQFVDQAFAQQREALAQAKGYIRTLSFELQYARTNAQSRELKGLPTSDEPSPELSTHLVMHEFEERPDEQLVETVRKSVGELGNVQPEVFIWALQRAHGEAKFFD